MKLGTRRQKFLLLVIATIKANKGSYRLSSKMARDNLGNQYSSLLRSVGIVCTDSRYSPFAGSLRCKTYGLKRLNIQVGASFERQVRKAHRAGVKASMMTMEDLKRFNIGGYLENSRRFMKSMGIKIHSIVYRNGRHYHAGASLGSSKIPDGLVGIDQHATTPWLLHTLAGAEEAGRWCRLFDSGDFYGRVAKLSGTKKTKIEILKILNSEGFQKRDCAFVRWFFAEFSTIARRWAAKLNHAGASIVSTGFLQKLEGALWSHAWRELDEEGIDCFQKHDSIICRKKDEVTVRQKLSEISDRLFGRSPRLKSQYY